MKKFYEAPVVELTGFSVEDVITTSVNPNVIDTKGMELDAAKAVFNTGYDAVNKYGSSYTW